MSRSGAIFTVGHSNRPLEGLLSLLESHGVRALLDVRRLPASRRNPHFAKVTLAAALARAGIEYVHVPSLGGHRTPRADSRNTAWTNDAFRGYADHMETDEFARALAELEALARERSCALMCAEADWRDCHRGLLSDRLALAGWRVLHLGGPRGEEEHPLTKHARIVAGRLDYSGPEQLELDLG